MVLALPIASVNAFVDSGPISRPYNKVEYEFWKLFIQYQLHSFLDLHVHCIFAKTKS